MAGGEKCVLCWAAAAAATAGPISPAAKKASGAERGLCPEVLLRQPARG